VAGSTYQFSAWIYHTEGYVRTTLYVGSFSNVYSNQDLINEWQQVTYSYTAEEDASIEVGLRFYDIGEFDGEEIVYVDNLVFDIDDETGDEDTTGEDDNTGSENGAGDDESTSGEDSSLDASTYYNSADGLSGLALKTALYNIIKDHTAKTYGDLWDFMGTNSLDNYYEKDGTILDMYSENPSTSETFNFTAFDDQCGSASTEGDCYNREHSFPKSWFGGEVFPMYTDIHHVYVTDGYVNNRRNNYPYGEVGTSTWVSENGSLLGSSTDSLGYTGTVFEPIDEFKGDFARTYFYMATRYEDIISTWETNYESGAAVLDSTSDYVYEQWVITMLKTWHENDPVSQKEIDRNEAAYEFQGNRNPFIDHPEYVNQIWVD
ncbi:endonuclease, partial [Psychromonas sp.]|nr:endonuclease [Psychromonas sp.]